VIWLALVLILVLGAGFVLLPYFRRERGADVSHLVSDVSFDPVMERKQIVLQNILELEFEYRMGKLSPGDYQNARGELEREAATLLDRIEAAGDGNAELEKKIDAELARRLEALPPTAPGRCPSCGGENPPTGRFCGQCGAPLEEAS